MSFYDWGWNPLQEVTFVTEAPNGESVNIGVTLFVEAELEIGKTIFKNIEKIFLNYDLFFEEVTDEWLFEIFNTIPKFTQLRRLGARKSWIIQCQIIASID